MLNSFQHLIFLPPSPKGEFLQLLEKIKVFLQTQNFDSRLKYFSRGKTLINDSSQTPLQGMGA
jgi:hypothetical protein